MRILDFADGFESASVPTTVGYAASGVVVTPAGNLSSTNAQAALTELQGDVDTINGKIGSASGIATLDGSGKVPVGQLPALAIISVYAVADITARNALTVQEGDVAIVADAGSGVSKTYIYDDNSSSWLEIVADGALAAHRISTTGIHGVSGNVVGTTDSQTLTNKIIDGDDNTVQDLPLTSIKTNLSDASKFVVRDASGIPVSNSKAVPSGTVVGTSDTQALTNKDIDGGTASNARRITIPKDTKANLDALTRKQGTLVYASDENKFYADNGVSLVEIGSGGAGGINYISNNGAENNTAGWSTYADAAGLSPVNATGGSPNVTFTRTTSSPLRGNASFLLTKDAANRQGEGVSYDFTIDPADESKQLAIGFDYAASANYTGQAGSEYLTVWVYDITNSVIIPCSNINAPYGNGTQLITFNSTSSTSYRLIFHFSGTGTSAWTYELDNLLVGPQQVVLSPAISDWNLVLAPSITSTGSSPTKGTTQKDFYYWRRVGSNLEVIYSFIQTGAGSSGTGTYLFNLIPTGLQIDTSKGITVADGWESGWGAGYMQGTNQTGTATVSLQDATTVRMNVNGSSMGATVNALGNANQEVSVFFSVPIIGWSSNIQLNNSRVEYASNSGMGDSDNTTSFVNDPNGSALPVVTYSTSRAKRVRFKNPILPTDTLVVQIQGAYGAWVDLSGDMHDGTSTSLIKAYNGDVGYGLGLYVQVNPTDYDVIFARYQEPATGNWDPSNSSRWRIVKYSNAVPVETGSKGTALYTFANATGLASGNTAIPYYGAVVVYRDTTNLLTVVTNSVDGLSVTANRPCMVTMSFPMGYNGSDYKGISLNSTQLSTTIDSITQADRMYQTFSTTNVIAAVGTTVPMVFRDVLRPHLSPGYTINSYCMIISAVEI